jgi:hypothetical protein
MHGDFTLDPLKYRDDVTRVLTQQGRVQLDSDANEQTETILRFLRALGRDIIGPHGGVGSSFELSRIGTPPALHIARGEYYVDGIRCAIPPGGDIWEIADDSSPAAADKRKPVSLKKLPNFVPPSDADANKQLLYYLDVYERHVSPSEEDSLREVALLGANTSSRALLTWRLRTLVIDIDFRQLVTRAKSYGWPFREKDDWYAALNLWLRTGVRMRAKAAGSESTNPCIISPEARYRGFENRLFRVEIHDPGVPEDPTRPERKPTFKWSQDNGSIVYPIRRVTGKVIKLASLGRDARTQICVNDWVEVVDDDVVINPQYHPLLQVVDVNPAEMTVELNAAPDANVGTDPDKHPILRRWASNLVELELRVPPKDAWMELADGVQIEFSRLPQPYAGLRPGDYWLIPTRTADGSVVWPKDNGVERDLPPNGIDHHYAPIAMMDGPSATPQDKRLRYSYVTG